MNLRNSIRPLLLCLLALMLPSCSLMREPKVVPFSPELSAKCDAPPGATIVTRMSRWVPQEPHAEPLWDTILPSAQERAEWGHLPPGTRLKILAAASDMDIFNGGYIVDLEVLSGPHRGLRFKTRDLYKYSPRNPAAPDEPAYPVLSPRCAAVLSAPAR